MTKFVQPDMVMVLQVSKDLGPSVQGDVPKRDVNCQWMAKPHGDISSLLMDIGLPFSPEFTTFDYLHMLNDLYILGSGTGNKKEHLLSYHNPTTPPSTELRMDIFEKQYKENPLNTRDFTLINVMEAEPGLDLDAICKKIHTFCRGFIAKKTPTGTLTAMDTPMFTKDFSILDLFKHAKKKDTENFPHNHLIFYSQLLIRLIFFFTIDSNETIFPSDKKGECCKKYQDLIDKSIKQDYLKFFGKDNCPYKVEDFRSKFGSTLKDFVFVIFIVKGSPVQKKKEIETTPIIHSEEKPHKKKKQ